MIYFNKLVRDKIPGIIEGNGEVAEYRTLAGEEFLPHLFLKLREEVDEFIDDPCVEELADVLEVLAAITDEMGIQFKDVYDAKVKKFNERGGYQNKILLIKAGMP